MGREGKIDLFPAGKYDEDFNKRITEFNWEEFKTLLDGNMYIAMLREQLKNLDYDYVFIDSRTGISDYSGYCTILLPDVNVFVIAPNSQNYKGSEKIARNILAHPYIQAGNRKPYMLPILSRLDKNAVNAQSKIETFNDTFNFLLNTWGKEIDSEILPLLFQEYSNETLLEYNANIAVGENLLFNPKKETKIGQQNFEHIANAFLEKVCEQKTIDFEENIEAETWFNWGYDFFENKKYNQAITCYQKSIDIKPDFYEALNNIGSVYNDELSEYEKAISYFQKACESEPDVYQAWYNLGNAYTNIEDYNQAIISYQKAIEIKPDSHEIWFNLGNVYFGIPDYKQAINSYQKALEIKPDKLEAWYNLGIVYTTIKDYNQAITCYQKAIEIKPDYHEAWYNLGNAYTNIEDYNEAIVCCKKAIEIKPDYYEVMSTIGFVYFVQGQFLEAEKYCLQTMFINESVMNLGHIRLSEQKPQEALVLYSQSLAMFTDKNQFFVDMQDDFKYLQAHGVSEEQYQGIIAELQKVE
jgi:tetratricopeptide (TPR) repeat protein